MISRKSPPSVTMQRMSHLILLALVLIAVTILVRHEYARRKNPAGALSMLPAASVPETESTASSQSPIRPPIFTPESSGFQPLGPPEQFGGTRLADKINGKAELYLGAGFAKLTTQRFQLVADPELWFELFQYEMGSAANAFAVYSAQRREDARSLDFVPHGYDTTNAIFLTLGSTYFEFIGSRATPELTAAMEQGLRILVQTHPEMTAARSSESPESFLPADRMLAQSLTLLATDAFGFDRLDKVYTAQYLFAETELTAFVSQRADGAEARDLAVVYGEFLVAFGGRDISVEDLPNGCQAIEVLDFIEFICSHDDYLFGIHEVTDLNVAGELIDLMYNHLKGLDHGSYGS